MIAARPEGLAVDVEAQPLGCASGWDLPVVERPDPLWEGTGWSNDEVDQALATAARLHALGIVMLAAAKCHEVRQFADRGAMDRDGADLFIRRYSESICDIASALAPEAMRESINAKGN
jgi:hypothetical protein